MAWQPPQPAHTRRFRVKPRGAVVRAGSSAEGEDIGGWLTGEPCGCRAVVALSDAVSEADIVIDASLPVMTSTAAERLAAWGGPPLVSGVTGLDPDVAVYAIQGDVKRQPKGCGHTPLAALWLSPVLLLRLRAGRRRRSGCLSR